MAYYFEKELSVSRSGQAGRVFGQLDAVFLIGTAR
jgi:hypothetical protein